MSGGENKPNRSDRLRVLHLKELCLLDGCNSVLKQKLMRKICGCFLPINKVTNKSNHEQKRRLKINDHIMFIV